LNSFQFNGVCNSNRVPNNNNNDNNDNNTSISLYLNQLRRQDNQGTKKIDRSTPCKELGIAFADRIGTWLLFAVSVATHGNIMPKEANKY
jgi:hypothetical protein